MNTGSTLTRDLDSKVFTVTLLSHWSEIKAETGEIDTVKWYGDNQYIGHSGNSYKLQEKK